MAVIKPTKKFIGSEIDLRDSGKYIKSDVKQVSFNKKNNPNGAWLYFLPPYKVDADGNGVWYKAFKIRDNFGDKYKEKYAVIDNDPVTHFERNFKILFPEEAKVQDSVGDDGQKRKVYPFYGRTTTRVVYNVAYVSKLEEGPHILDLPSWNGASIINAWLSEKDTKGRERPVLNDPERCIPVFIKLKDGGGAPWQIEPSQGEASAIPDDIADSDNLYNLDDIFVKKTPGELIEKLKSMYSSSVFEQCMAGYPGFDKEFISDTPIVSPVKKVVTSVSPQARPVTAVNNIPKVAEEKVEVEYVEADDDLDLSPAPPKVTVASAAEFLRRPRPQIKLED